MKIASKLVGVGLILAILILAAKEYSGYQYFFRYKSARARARSIEKSFPELERNLMMAVKFSKNPVFYEQMGQLYREMAVAESKFGSEEKRDSYLDRASESLAELIKRNPIDAFAYFEMGRVYLFYNFPLLTYAHRAKVFFLRALELKPADEYLNLNVIYFYLTQWDYLEDGEKDFIFKRLKSMWKNNENFIIQVRNLWRENFEDTTDKLEKILSQDKDFWSKISKFFPSTTGKE